VTTETIAAAVPVASRRAGEQTRAVRAWARIALPCALAAGLVLYQLTSRSLWLDEAASVSIASQHGHALSHAISHDGGNMLGYYLFLHILIGAFGDAAAVIRLPSALATVATVALVCLIARRMVDRRGVLAQRMVGRRGVLAAGLLAAVSLPLVFWGQDARGYAPMMTFIAASFLSFIGLVDDDGARARWWCAAYVASTVLAAYMSFVALLVVPAQLLAWLWSRGRPRAVVTAVAAIGVCSLPLAVLAERRGSGQLFWVAAPTWKGIGQMARWLTSAGMPPNFHPTATTVVTLVVSLVLLAVVGIAVIRSRRGSWVPQLIAAWLVVPVLLSIAESFAGQPILLYRNSLVALPAVALLLAWGLMHPGVPKWLGLSGLGVLLALRALQLGPSYGISPENWKGAASYVSARVQSGDCIAFFPSDGRMPFGYYAGSTLSASLTPVLPAASWSATRPFVEQYTLPSASRLAAIAAACPRLWLIASHYGARNGSAASRANYAHYAGLRGALASRYAGHANATFGWARPVRVQLFSR